MLDIKFIEYIVLLIMSIPSGFLTYFMVIGLAKSAVDGHRRKFFIKLLITIFLIGLIYTVCHTIFASISVEKAIKHYSQLTTSYNDVKISEWSEKKNTFVKNQLLYNFYYKNKNGEVCEDLRNGVTDDLKNEINKITDFDNTQFAKESIMLCEITSKYKNIEDDETCATKENGFLCSWINPIFKNINTDFKIYSIEPPKDLEEKKIIDDNPLDKEEKLIN
jgi:hypothetical protein